MLISINSEGKVCPRFSARTGHDRGGAQTNGGIKIRIRFYQPPSGHKHYTFSISYSFEELIEIEFFAGKGVVKLILGATKPVLSAFGVIKGQTGIIPPLQPYWGGVFTKTRLCERILPF